VPKVLLTINTVDDVLFTVSFPYGAGNPNRYSVTIAFTFSCTGADGAKIYLTNKDDANAADFVLISSVVTKPDYLAVSTALDSAKTAMDLYVAQRIYNISGNLLTGYAQTGGVVYKV
jgi:hypothetical protein